MDLTQLVHVNLDLALVGLAVAGIALLGFLVIFNNPHSVTNRVFLLFALLTVAWGISNYFEYKLTTIDATLWALRIHLFISTWHALAFFTFCYVFPKEQLRFPNWYVVLLAVVFAVSILTLTPAVFSGITELAAPGNVTNPERGPGIAIFSAVAFGLLIGGLYILWSKWRASASHEHRQNKIVFFGMLFTAVLILCFNVFLPVALGTLTFIPLAALFVLPLIGSMAYAIMRYHLFNSKVVTAEIFSFLLCVVTLVQVMFSSTLPELIFRAVIFVFVLVVAILFVRSVVKEIRLREQVEIQERELEIVNRKQESLLHFISHEIKGYLTKGQNAFAGIVEGDYGAVSAEVKTLSTGALHEMRKGVSTVMDILDASNFKKGSMSYDMKPIDLKAVVLEIADDMRKVAEQKGLQFEITFAPSGSYAMTGDDAKLRRHVIRNLIDNSIKYTLEGKITVSLARAGNMLRFAVSDTGVGIDPADMPRMFTEGGKGKDSIKVNVDSTGYGLFVAKQVTEGHGGKISVHSDGPGKGSTFTVDLPTA